MLSKRIFETDFRTALDGELQRRDMTIKELADISGIPLATLYKISSGVVDVRLSTIKKIVAVLEPELPAFVAVIAAKFLLDELEGHEITIRDRVYRIRGYTANSIEECIIASVMAEKEGAAGIICAPILASMVEKIVDIPVAIMKPKAATVIDALDAVARRIGA
ncbi:MAG: helix-turn-helix domain-containing protein [Methanoregula sp.]|jgi:predicted transcriptional regulator|nr:helix-turn-helix domain-containing protein [Methanoregula sp.]